MTLSLTLDKTLKVGPPPESTELREALLEGLRATAPQSLPQGFPSSISWRKHLPLRTLYEFEGINFYEAITQDPEYYLYRNEVNLLRQCVDKVVHRLQNPDAGEQCIPDRPVSRDSINFIDLGAGRTEKASLLLRECCKNREGLDLKYWPIDLQYDLLESRLAELADSLTNSRVPTIPDSPPRRHGGGSDGTPNRIQLRGICGSWFDALGQLARGNLPGMGPTTSAADRHCYLWLGSSLTNMTPAEGVGFLGRLARECLRPQDTLLVGVDVCRDVATVMKAYGTPRWHAYIANGLGNARRILGEPENAPSATFGNPARDWEYVACWDPVDNRHVRFARSKKASSMRIPFDGETSKAVQTISFEEGEHVLLGQSYKWRRYTVEAIFREAGLAIYDAWFDAGQETAIYLLGNRPF